jgi:hypothetical protein
MLSVLETPLFDIESTVGFQRFVTMFAHLRLLADMAGQAPHHLSSL